MTKVTMDKQWVTRDGRAVQLLGVDLPGRIPWSVIGLLFDSEGQSTVETWKADGDYCSLASPKDLVEKAPFADFKLDEPVMVLSDGLWVKRHFAGVNKAGEGLFFPDGMTSWTYRRDSVYRCGPESVFKSMRKPTEEELKNG